MSYVLWHRDGQTRIASPCVVLRAAELPRLADAMAVRDALERLHAEAGAHVHATAEAARSAAREDALQEGRRLAQEEAAQRLDSLSRAAAQDRERLRDDVGALALQVVRKMLGRFAADDVLLALADQAAAEALPERPAALVVHPNRIDAVRARIESGDPSSALRACALRTDPACELDTCRLETAVGSIDASLDAQLARLEAAWNDGGAS
ncbi:MAG: FliH/SctL family protein [Rubrivivax sp.]